LLSEMEAVDAGGEQAELRRSLVGEVRCVGSVLGTEDLGGEWGGGGRAGCVSEKSCVP